MTRVNEDSLKLFLRGLETAERDRATQLIKLLRVVRDDTRGGDAPRIALDPKQLARELPGHVRAQARGAIHDLLRHYLHALLGVNRFPWFGNPRHDHDTSWAALIRRAEFLELNVQLPRPGDDELLLVHRLLGALDDLGEEVRCLEHWKARALIPGRTEEARVRLEKLRTELATGSPLRALAAADLATVELDAGAPTRARYWLQDVGGSSSSSSIIRQYSGWCDVLIEGRLPEAFVPGGPAPVPGPLVDLRRARPDLAMALLGPERVVDAPGRGSLEAEFDNGNQGASVCEWVDFMTASSRGVAPPGSGTIQELLRHGRVVVRRSEAPGVPPEEASSKGTRSLALAPGFGASGEFRGWLRLEWDHWLVPAVDRLIRAASVIAEGHPANPELDSSRVLLEPSEGQGLGIRQAFFEEVVSRLEVKLRNRRWTFFLPLGTGEWQAVATGGGGFSGSTRGGACAVARSAFGGVPVILDGPDPEQTIVADAASAIYIPVFIEGKTVALLAIESSRRRDFRVADVERIDRLLESQGHAIRSADLDSWHRGRFGEEFVFPIPPNLEPRWVRIARSVARGRGPVALVGPRSCGKRLLARWIHFESPSGRKAPFTRFEARPPDADQPGLLDLWPRGAGSVFIAHAERLGCRDQVALLEKSGRREGPRVIVSLEAPPSELARIGRLEPTLAARLDRGAVEVPGLSDRRQELARAIPRFLTKVCREEGLEVPALQDDALACLWRQPWTDNVAELQNTLAKLAYDRAGESVGESELRETLEVFGIQLLHRLPSRNPRLDDVRAALEVTVKVSGRWNKTRAAAYLGWDPDTLVARMQDLGIEDAVSRTPSR